MTLEDHLYAEANRQHDAEHHDVNMDPEARFPRQARIVTNVDNGPLTDRKIERYQREGWYSAEFKQARRELQLKKQKEKRLGNFVDVEGRLIYSPI